MYHSISEYRPMQFSLNNKCIVDGKGDQHYSGGGRCAHVRCLCCNRIDHTKNQCTYDRKEDGSGVNSAKDTVASFERYKKGKKTGTEDDGNQQVDDNQHFSCNTCHVITED